RLPVLSTLWHAYRHRVVNPAGGSAARTKTRRRFRPELLSLEERVVPQATVSVSETAAANGSAATAQALPSDSPVAVTGGISVAGDEDYYAVVVPAGGRVWAYVDTGGTQAARSTSRDSQLTLFNTNGTQVVLDNDNGATGNGGDTTVETTNLSSALSAVAQS